MLFPKMLRKAAPQSYPKLLLKIAPPKFLVNAVPESCCSSKQVKKKLSKVVLKAVPGQQLLPQRCDSSSLYPQVTSPESCSPKLLHKVATKSCSPKWLVKLSLTSYSPELTFFKVINPQNCSGKLAKDAL